VTGLPPSFAGAVHDTVADWVPATAKTFVGASGTVVEGVVTGADGAEGALVPTVFLAVTWNVYCVAVARPVTVAVVPVTTTFADGALGEMSTV
jgi:hypothetical protein